MRELDEIMNGKHEIKHLHIDGDTIAFETELDNYTWNLTPRDIEMIIYNLQERIKETIEYCENNREYTPRLAVIRDMLKGEANEETK